MLAQIFLRKLTISLLLLTTGQAYAKSSFCSRMPNAYTKTLGNRSSIVICHSAESESYVKKLLTFASNSGLSSNYSRVAVAIQFLIERFGREKFLLALGAIPKEFPNTTIPAIDRVFFSALGVTHPNSMESHWRKFIDQLCPISRKNQ